MIYASTITTAANTAKVDAVKTTLRVTKGLVWKIEIEFPPGCSGLAHLKIMDGSYQVFPASPGESFHSDAAVIGFDDLYLKTSEPFEFVIQTWNLDETWPHTLQVRLGVASSEAEMSRYIPSLSWESFQKSMAKAQAEQEEVKRVQIEEILKGLGEL